MPPASLPVAATANDVSIGLAPRPDGGLFVSIAAAGGTVLASLDAAGQLRRGWPVVVVGYSGCEIAADPADGSVRAVCAASHPARTRAFAYDDAGRLLAGWPADLPGSLDEWDRERPRLVDGELYVVTHGWNPPSAALLRVSAEGIVRTGANLWGLMVGDSPGWSIGEVAIGPDATAYVAAYSPDLSTMKISAVDLEGLLPGWPIQIDGFASAPSVNPGGHAFVAVGLGALSSQILAFARDGRAVPGWPATLPVAAPSEWHGEGDGPLAAPVVASDGSTYVATEEGDFPSADGTTAYAVDAAGNLRAGWPYRAPTGLVWLGECACSATGCGWWRSDPVAAPDGSLYLLHQAPSPGAGGSIVAVATDGVVKAGWPVVLRRAGAEFSSVAVGPDGTAFALAIEPEGFLPDECGQGGKVSLDSATILAIGPDGTVRYRTTIVSP
jgi:hypothetical protein